MFMYATFTALLYIAVHMTLTVIPTTLLTVYEIALLLGYIGRIYLYVKTPSPNIFTLIFAILGLLLALYLRDMKVVVSAFITILIILWYIFKHQTYIIEKYFVNFDPNIIYRKQISENAPLGEKKIALTIDDGILGQNTIKTMDVLIEEGVPASWFLIGANIRKNDTDEKILNTMKLHKHELCNHMMINFPTAFMSEKDLTDSIVANELVIYKGANPVNKWFRPGCGFYTPTTLRVCKELGYKIVLGNVFPHDPCLMFSLFTDFVAQHIIDNTTNGSILILHDFMNTAAVLKKVVPELKRRGYTFVTLTDLMA